jgi:ribosomal protein L11 methyltransferase
MNQSFYYTVQVKTEGLAESLIEEIDEQAIVRYMASGKQEADIDEEEVDKILGERAYSGGDIPEEVIYEVVDKAKKNEVLYYFSGEQSKENAFAFSKELGSLGAQSALLENEESDWLEEWRKTYKTIEVAVDLKIVPSWEKEKNQDDELYIYPGMGFGTGTHETTYLCLKLFSQISFLDEKISTLDFGCGSGILGIAAIKKYRSCVDFVDVDTKALDNCLENLKINDFELYSSGHSLVLRERFEPVEYNLVFANILRPILIEERDLLIESMKKGSFLILSGLLNGQEKEIKKSYSSLSFLKMETKGDWVALLFRKDR